MASVDDNEPVAADAPATEEMDTSCTVGRPGRLNPLRSSKVSPVAEIDVEPPRIPPFEIEDDTLEKELELVTKRKKRKKWIVLGAAVALILVVVLVLGAVVGIIIATWPTVPRVGKTDLNFTRFSLVKTTTYPLKLKATVKMFVSGSLSVTLDNRNTVSVDVGSFTGRIFYLGQDLIDIEFAGSTLDPNAETYLVGAMGTSSDTGKHVIFEVNLPTLNHILVDAVAQSINVVLEAKVPFTVRGFAMETAIRCEVRVFLKEKKDGTSKLKVKQTCVQTD